MKFLILILLMNISHANEFAGKDIMNYIKFSEIKGFEEKWKIVTIRFRKDTGEMRITYANDIAMDSLMSGAVSYPDGAIFTKIGFHTTSDPQFESSTVPVGVSRYQVMVKNKTKYTDTGGWGFGLFDPQGKTFPEEPVSAQNACYACHEIVHNRGDVFSQPFSISPNAKYHLNDEERVPQSIIFNWISKKKLPKAIAEILGKKYSKIRFLNHEKMRTFLFQGTLDEVKPMLESQAMKFKSASLFASKDFKRFTLVLPVKNNDCYGNEGFEVYMTDKDFKVNKELLCAN